MNTNFKQLSQGQRWAGLVESIKTALQSQGYELVRVPGRGLANVWKGTKNGETVRIAFRTSQDRYIAFQPENDGQGWKTLDDVQLVAVATVDVPDNPQKAEVYLLPAQDLRERFSAAYQARKEAGQVQRSDFGMWVGLDENSGSATSVGTGILKKYEPIGVYALDDPATELRRGQPSPAIESAPAPPPATIAAVMQQARELIARIAGVGVESVRLELKLET